MKEKRKKHWLVGRQHLLGLARSAASPPLPAVLSRAQATDCPLVPSHSLSLSGRADVVAEATASSPAPPSDSSSSSLSSTVVVVTLRPRAAAEPPRAPCSSSEDEDVSALRSSSSAAASPNLSGGRARREGLIEKEKDDDEKTSKAKMSSSSSFAHFLSRRPSSAFSFFFSINPLFSSLFCVLLEDRSPFFHFGRAPCAFAHRRERGGGCDGTIQALVGAAKKRQASKSSHRYDRPFFRFLDTARLRVPFCL